MANTEQLATSVSPEIYTRFCAIAAERNLSNAALLRELVVEFLEAYDAGRAIFQNEAAPRLDASVSGLVHQLRELVIELDRAQADNAKLYGKLIADWNGGEEANRIAQERLFAKFRKQDAESLDPFKKAVARIIDELSALPSDIIASLEPKLAHISQQLEASIELAKRPRQMRALYLGSDRMLSLKFLSACAGLTLFAGLMAGIILPGLFDGWSVWQARKMIDDPAQMCRLINSKYGTDDCAVPTSERDLGLRVIAREDRR